jgi:cholesterol oxidase
LGGFRDARYSYSEGASLQMTRDFDVIVVGSGFGGSVAALRLTEKGYRVAVIEAGRRFEDKDFAKTSWRLRRFLYAPRLGMNGIQRIHFLKDVLILCGAGVGGGSLVYANTLYVPPETYFRDKQWAHITDWQRELSPFYDLASRMLGVAENPFFSPSDAAMKRVAEQTGRGHTFRLTPVGVYFGDGPGKESSDPFFGGVGPARRGCTHCGECMTGCRHNAKNTLLKNYLYLAEKAGTKVFAGETVTSLLQTSDGWKVVTRSSSGFRTRTLTARQVIVAAGTYNSQRLLHRMKATSLPQISDRLGYLSRTNSESLVGSIMPSSEKDFSQGVAITSSFHPDDVTHVEPVRYGHGSNAMGLLQTLMTDSNDPKVRRRQWRKLVFAHPRMWLKIMNVRKWSERTVIALVMQNVESSVRVFLKNGKLTSQQDSENPNANYIPAANDTARKVAENEGGIAAGHYGDLIGAPFTAHFVGGCVIGDSPASGVIDPYHRIWNYPTLHIVDGSAVTANLGVNPSLTITAQAERAMSMWPNKGDADQRPSQQEKYREIAPIAPAHPVVPAHAPAALKFTN